MTIENEVDVVDTSTVSPANDAPEADTSVDAALAAFREAKAAGKAKSLADAAESTDKPAADGVDINGEPKAVEKPTTVPATDMKPAVDPEVAKLFNRLTASEQQARADAEELKKLRARAQVADEWEAAAEDAATKKNPKRLFSKIKWDGQVLNDYIADQGDFDPAKTATKELEVRAAALEKKLAEREARDAERERHDLISTHKAAISKELAPKRDTFPFLFADAETDQGVGEQVFELMAHLYNTEGKEISFDAAAATINQALQTRYERLHKATAKPAPAPGSAPSATKSVPVVVKQKPVEEDADEGDDPDSARALRELKRIRSAGKK